jgi:uncharacterized protein YllA (UPF0747 family)
LKLSQFPGLPKIWIDYIERRAAALPLPAPYYLKTRPEALDFWKNSTPHPLPKAGLVMENMDPLRQPGAVAVIANIRACLFGGSASQLIKCLAAAKICDVLRLRDIPAVPIIWIHPLAPNDASDISVNILDSDAELHRLFLNCSGGVLPDTVLELLSCIRDLRREPVNPEIMSILQEAYTPGTTLSQATARLFSILMNTWHPVVVDSQSADMEALMAEAIDSLQGRDDSILDRLGEQDSGLAKAGYALPAELENGRVPMLLVQSSLFRVLAVMLDPDELFSFARALPVLDMLGAPQPLAWPAACATILDARSRRTLEKYHLHFEDLFFGEEEVTRKIAQALPHTVPDKLDNLAQEIDREMARLDISGFEADLLKTRDDCKEKALYQLGKLRDHFQAVLRQKRETVQRQVHRACNALAPHGRSQGREIAGVHFLLRYSQSLLRSLYNELDVMSVEHQLIRMD